MSKHTPGPWNVFKGSGDWGMPITHSIYVGDDPYNVEKEICEVYSIQPHFAGASKKDKERYIEGNANARLIAAAPELLEALEELMDIEGPQPGTAAWADKTRALIAKAKGDV